LDRIAICEQLDKERVRGCLRHQKKVELNDGDIKQQDEEESSFYEVEMAD